MSDLRERIKAAITDLVEIQREPERPVNYEADSWSCLVGFARRDTMPEGSDGPMRDGVRDAFLDLTGEYPDFIFSGWGRHPSEAQAAVIENREPVYKETNFGKIANAVALLKDVLASMEQPKRACCECHVPTQHCKKCWLLLAARKEA